MKENSHVFIEECDETRDRLPDLRKNAGLFSIALGVIVVARGIRRIVRCV
jgi:hypothetical protein